MADVTEKQIRDRLIEVEELIAKHEVAIAYLRQELPELQTAVRVFDRFHDRPDYSGMLPQTLELEEPEARKPAGIPTMPEMIIEVLQVADTNGRGALEPKEITAEIRKKWWPSAPSSSVSPIAWRLANEGRLQKVNSRYSPPNLFSFPPEETDLAAPEATDGVYSGPTAEELE